MLLCIYAMSFATQIICIQGGPFILLAGAPAVLVPWMPRLFLSLNRGQVRESDLGLRFS